MQKEDKMKVKITSVKRCGDWAYETGEIVNILKRDDSYIMMYSYGNKSMIYAKHSTLQECLNELNKHYTYEEVYETNLTKEEFDKLYLCNNTVINCKAEELAIEFLTEAHEHGYKWCTGESYLSDNCWENHKDKTCYNICTRGFSDKGYYESKDYTIIDFKGFSNIEEDSGMKKSELKTGMVVELRDKKGSGVVYGDIIKMTNPHPTGLENKYYDVQLKYYNDDLMYSPNEAFDIIKISRVSETVVLFKRMEKSETQLAIEKLQSDKADYDRKFDERIAELNGKLQ